MSEYQKFLKERELINSLVQKGFRITNVTENVSGAFVKFEKKEQNGSLTTEETLHIVTPDGRKYFSAILLRENQEE